VDHWGTANQPYWRPGPNYTVDIVVIANQELLLIQRGGSPFRGSWALPGGFHETNAPKGFEWRQGRETASEAAARELLEETGVDLSLNTGVLTEIGVFDRFGRDPRDNSESWAVTTGFLVTLQKKPDVFAGDDASDAKWLPISCLSEIDLAFDHQEIIAAALKIL